MTKHLMKLSEPWYTFVKEGVKTVEGRIYDDKRKKLNVGDIIIFTNTEGNGKLKQKKIIKLKVFKTFEKGIRYSKLKNILPIIKTYKDGVKIYRSIPGYKEGIKKYGFIVIFFE